MYGCKSAISSAFPRVSPKVKTKLLIIIYLQGLLKKAAKSGRKEVVCKKSCHERYVATVVTMLQCYMLHVTLRRSHCALPPRAGKVERAGGGLGRRAGGRQEWPWQEGERDRGADR